MKLNLFIKVLFVAKFLLIVAIHLNFILYYWLSIVVVRWWWYGGPGGGDTAKHMDKKFSADLPISSINFNIICFP